MDNGREGLVITHRGRTVLVEDARGGLHDCALRRSLGPVVCGDRVRWRASAAGQGVIEAVRQRRTLLSRHGADGRGRPLAANVDRIVIVCAPRPPLSEALIDRYLVAAELLGCAPLVLVNKEDLLDGAERGRLEARLREYEAIGCPVLFASTRRPASLSPLNGHLQGRTSILVGQSGVGKSSLAQVLLPERDIRIGELSGGGAQGRHTTSSTTLYHLPGGGDLIDSPGVRDFGLWPVEASELARGFREFRDYSGQCRFHNCRHMKEPGCALQRAADAGEISARRLASYREILGE